MAMEPWNPWREMMNMRDVMDRMFQDTFVRAGSGFLGRASVPLDIQETDSGYEVEATLPGVRPEDVQITVQDDTLTIRGEIKAQEERSGQNWITRERRSGSFYRSVTLPATIDADRATASFEHGVLRLTLPRSAQAGPKQIRIGASPSQVSQPSGAPRGVSASRAGMSGTGPADTEGVAAGGPRSDTGLSGAGPSDREGVAGANPRDTSGLSGIAPGGLGMTGAETSQQQPS